MKIIPRYLSQKLFTLLNGNVIYDDSEGYNRAVPVVEAGSGATSEQYQIIIADYSDADRSNKHEFAGNASQLIEIVSERSEDSSRIHVDTIGEAVTNLIHPTVTSNILSNTDFSICVQGRPSVNYLTEDSGSGTQIVRLLLRYNLLINENT
jgi:hypothetical protein